MIIIDYLQLMSGSGGRSSDSRQQEISDISRSLKAVARELSVPVLALSQLSRAVEQRPDHRPMLSDLRESGAIEQDADVVMFIYRDDYYNHDSPDKGISEIIIAKQRNGPIGTVQLAWLPEYTKFANLENDRKKISKYITNTEHKIRKRTSEGDSPHLFSFVFYYIWICGKEENMGEYLLISDAAKQVKVESHVLRYWEEELHLPIKRNELGHRYYTKEDVERFKEIKSMKERGLQLKAIK